MPDTDNPGMSSGQQKDCYTPERLEHGLSGWPPAGPNVFRWKNERLMFSIDGSNLSVAPTPEEWMEFWRICDEVDLWSWPVEIGDMDVMDGLQYHLEITVGSRSVKSRGQVVDSPAGFQERLMKIHGGLQNLAGWLGSGRTRGENR